MRSKLNLTDDELMKSSWISLKLQMMDYPYYNYHAKNEENITDPERTEKALQKYMK